MTTAAIASSSSPLPIVESPDDDRAATSIPANPPSTPVIVYSRTLTRATRKPIRTAASSAPPMAKTA